ncbi:MAG: 3-phosphoshikimate 1-carboxyvinyltransferase [Campylobacteraceae bacterium]|jgi:3-phosphoshikimate 1-carboxyvinyltransferase|nr:3-phosphoshikimate 1-carboxyvinyltransferase [Campylobacteraceae bacterium]
MSSLRIGKAKAFSLGLSDIASDKSISHRCAIFSLLSDKTSVVRNYLEAEDTLCTLNIVKSLGAILKSEDGILYITPPSKIIEPPLILDCGNSGTAMRLLMGFLSSVEGFFVLHGDKYLASRPMKRVAKPLRDIGAKIDGRKDGDLSPICIRGSKLKPFDYKSPISSAQVKSALILSALNSQNDAPSFFSEPQISRDHTERMLKGMGVDITYENGKIVIPPTKKPLQPLDITVPADPSSAFFFAVAAAIVPDSKVVLKNVLLNKTRVEAYKILQKMGTKIEFIEKDDKYESIGDIVVEYAPLCAVEVSENISWLIDELPALSIAFACAKGTSRVKNAKELRVKESDRISAVVKNLQLCGIEAKEADDGYDVTGGVLKEAVFNSFGDHRIAMSFAIASLVCGGTIEDTECISTSFPNFTDTLKKIGKVDTILGMRLKGFKKSAE